QHRAGAAGRERDTGCDAAPHHLSRLGFVGWNALQASCASLNAGESGFSPLPPPEPRLWTVIRTPRPPLPTCGSGMSTPCWRMQWANLSAWSRSSAIWAGESFGAAASRYFWHDPFAESITRGEGPDLHLPPNRIFVPPP